ncbi:MAG: hypothetical protein C0467_21875 [Planctomycetaceae bacterium]|nr:hypothetical protein [Planctomycetaceae bacterium]
MPMAEPQPSFDELLDCYLTGTLSQDQAVRLLSLLESHPDLGSELLDQFTLDAKMRDLAGQDLQVAPPREVTEKASTIRPARKLPWVVAALAIAAAIVVLTVRISGPTISPVPTPSGEESTTVAVAVLTRTVGAEWAEPQNVLVVGAALEPGWLKLTAGLAEVEFFSGARVVLQGPAEFRLLSSNEAFCKTGRLTAEVPTHASGFRIGTPQGSLIDRGTAFGLSVSTAGAEVHVFQGKVELHRTAGQHDLTTGQAVAVAHGGVDRRLPADPTGFVTRPDLDRRENDATAQQREKWGTSARAWNADPALLVRFDFEGPSAARTLRNAASNGSPVGSGTVVGCERADGHWPGKGALEFGRVGDRVRLAVPGELQSLSLLTRVRVGGLDRRYNSLLMSDAFDPGAVHWQVLSDGRVRLGIAAKPHHTDYDSPQVFTPNRLGQWVHLAVVYDAINRRVTHYADGVPLHRQSLTFDVALRPGRAELGNWTSGTRSDRVPIRHFSGRMDEFAAFSRPLSDDEVSRHADGRPPRDP